MISIPMPQLPLRNSRARRLPCTVLSEQYCSPRRDGATKQAQRLLIRRFDLGGRNGTLHSRAKPSELQKAIAASAIDPARNEIQHAWLIKLLAKEIADGFKPLHELY